VPLALAAAMEASTRCGRRAKAIIDAMNAAGHELQAIGNNLNQIARHLNTTGDRRDWAELREAIALNGQWTERRIAALDRVLDSIGIA
jgi:ferritin-like metal-binding protein YciE